MSNPLQFSFSQRTNTKKNTKTFCRDVLFSFNSCFVIMYDILEAIRRGQEGKSSNSLGKSFYIPKKNCVYTNS